MRIISRALFITLIFALLAVTAYAAESNEYYIDEIGLNISVPSYMIVFTPDTPAADPNFALLEIDGTALLEQFKTRI